MAAPTTQLPIQPIPPWTPPVPPVRPGGPRSRRHPLAVLAVVVALLSGLAVGILLQGKAPAAGPAAVTVPQSQPATAGLPPQVPPAGVEIIPPSANPAPAERRGSAAQPPAAQPPAAQPPAAQPPAAQPPAAEPAPAPAPPRVVGQVAYPNPMRTAGCSGQQASVLAKIETDGEPRAVTLFSRSPAGAGSAVPMVKLGEGWVATLGPYPTAGTATWAVEVTDARGVTVTGPLISLRVLACPPR